VILREQAIVHEYWNAMNAFSAYRRQWWQAVRKGGKYVSTLCTVLTFLTLLVVSGPHLVHHLLAPPPQHDDHHSHDDQPPQGPDCLVLFLMQHTPVAEGWVAPLPAFLLVTERIACVQPPLICAIPQRLFQARAPPFTLL
jgi:hypothetical protein